jgi:hypothetical protein
MGFPCCLILLAGAPVVLEPTVMSRVFCSLYLVTLWGHSSPVPCRAPQMTAHFNHTSTSSLNRAIYSAIDASQRPEGVRSTNEWRPSRPFSARCHWLPLGTSSLLTSSSLRERSSAWIIRPLLVPANAWEDHSILQPTNRSADATFNGDQAGTTYRLILQNSPVSESIIDYLGNY